MPDKATTTTLYTGPIHVCLRCGCLVSANQSELDAHERWHEAIKDSMQMAAQARFSVVR